MGTDDFRYSAQVQVDDEWRWFLEPNGLGDAKHHLRCRINKNPELNGRVVDKKTGETVFIDLINFSKLKRQETNLRL
ncbi:MAG: hypothetical protein HUU38_16750 [Anaerolineales bacterium]|nr:hypothetical protein [Anaerolineales bacterium]